jgi:DNA-binding transcriptional LysR family regulator
MDYNKLATFLCVCEAGGFTKASLKLLRSQSAVSQQIQSLEDELGLTLILRKKEGIRLTNEGAALFQTLKHALPQIDDTVARLTDTSSQVAASVRVGVIADFGSERMVAIVGELRKLYPNVDFHFAFKNTSREVEAACEANEIDFGIVIFIRKPELYTVIKLTAIENVLAASPQYLKENRIRRAQDLVNAHLIDFTQDFTAIGYWIRIYAPKMLKDLQGKKPIAVVPSQKAVSELVKAGIGVGVLQPRLFPTEFATGQIVEVLPQTDRPFMVAIHLVYKNNRKLRNFEEKLVELLCRSRNHNPTAE